MIKLLKLILFVLPLLLVMVFTYKIGTADTTPSLRLVNDGGTFYLIKDNQRFGITNPGMLFTYGFEFKDAQPAQETDLALPLGQLLLPGDGSLVKSPVDPTIWLISGGKKFGFVSQEVFLSLGFNFSTVLTVTAPELEKLSQGSLLNDINASHLDGVDINDKGTIYWLSGGKKYGYPSVTVYNSWHRDGNFSQVVPANTADTSLPLGGVVSERVFNTGAASTSPNLSQDPPLLPNPIPTPISTPTPTPTPTSTPTPVTLSLLYNPGPKYIAGKTIVDDSTKTAILAPWVSVGSSLAQALLVGNPAGLCPQGLQGTNVENATNTPAANGACESYYNDTRFWWKSTERQQWPGWDVYVAGDGNGTPLELFYANHAYPLSQCTSQVREVGIAYDGNTSIRPNMNLGQFKSLTGKFDLSISAQNINPALSCPNGYDAPFQNVTDPWGYISADFRVNYFKPDGTWVRGDIFSVHVYNAQTVTNKDVFWQNPTCVVNPANNQYGCVLMINPSAAGISTSAIAPGDGYKTFVIDFKNLYKKFITPPAGFTTDDAVVGGYDIYSSVRGADVNFSLKNIDLIGTK